MTKRRAHGDGSIFKRASDGRWVGILDLGYTDGKRQRKTVYGKTRREVADALKAVQQQHEQGLPVAGEKQTVAAYLASWLTTVVKPNVRTSTYASYERIVRCHIVPAIGQVPLLKLTGQDVQRFLAKMQATHAPSYVRLCRTVLRIALQQALRWRLVATNAAQFTNLPRTTPSPRAFLTPDQARVLLHAAANTRYETLYRVALSLGLRRGEVLGLRWQDLDFDNMTLRVEGQLQYLKGQGLQWLPPKTATSRRTLPLPAVLAQSLRQHRHRQLQERLIAGSTWHDTGLVFTTGIGTGIHAATIQKDFTALLERAGLPPMTFHSLRHSCATLLAAQDVQARVVMEILGHSNIDITLGLYTHALAETTRDGIDALEHLLENSG
jgi:integrase